MALLGEIDGSSILYSEGKGTIVGDAAHELKKLLGNGYGRRQFHMELDGVRLEDCRVVSPKMVFTYRLIRRIEELGFDDDEPDTYVTSSQGGDIALPEDDADTWPPRELE
jgi:hypothetical protein